MDTFEAIRTRRAIKKFDSSYKMTPEQVKSLMELVILSPTSYNQQNWRFITVTDQSVKEKISKLQEIKLTKRWFFGSSSLRKHECLER